jgi:hypothetical protein
VHSDFENSNIICYLILKLRVGGGRTLYITKSSAEVGQRAELWKDFKESAGNGIFACILPVVCVCLTALLIDIQNCTYLLHTI